MKIGIVIGSFLPLHHGSLTVCKVAQALSKKLIIIIINTPNDPIPIKLRVKWLKAESPKAIVIATKQQSDFSFKDQLNNLLRDFSKKFNSDDFHLFSSNPSSSPIAKKLKIKCSILDPDRLSQNIKSKDILADPYSNWLDMPISVRSSLIRRVVLIGPESVGKSTLAEQLRKSIIRYPFLPEYGRPYEIFREPGYYKNHEFEDIISVHAAHRKALLPFSGPIFVEDTDELATAVWAEMLMGKRLPSVEKKINLPYLYLLLDPSVPFISEETRYFNNEKRVEFFNKIKAKLDYLQASYTTIKGPWSTRNQASKKIIKKLLDEKTKWLEIGN